LLRGFSFYTFPLLVGVFANVMGELRRLLSVIISTEVFKNCCFFKPQLAPALAITRKRVRASGFSMKPAA